MRTVVLSDDRIIEFLNEHFINTWGLNAELGHHRSLQDPIAKRRKREGKTFDTSTPLTRVIMNGWQTGSKKSSPVDCLIISPECELMGRQPVNDFFMDCKSRYLSYETGYHEFLMEALAGKQPGLGNIVLTPDRPAQEVLDVYRVSEATVVVIDVNAFENGGTLTIDIGVGRSDGIVLIPPV